MYTPDSRPDGADVDVLARYLDTELSKISRALLTTQTQQVQLVERHSVPDRPREGLLVFADGSNWNPGSGRGVYVYSSSAWVKL